MVDHKRANLALAALSVSTFTFVTTEILPVGLLTLMADDLHRSRSQVGLLMTGYAVVVVLLSLPLARITQRVPRRLLLGGTLGVFSAATLVTALAPGYGVLLGARLVVGATQALFWSIVATTATSMFPPQRRGRTVARLSIGAAVAPVLGVPLGTWLGQQAGWRAAFLVMAAVGAATCAALVAWLPAHRPGTPAVIVRGSAPDGRRFLILVLCTAIGVTGAMTAQTYVTPFLLDVTGFAPDTLGPLLLVGGVAGLAGTVVVGRFLDRHPYLAHVVPMALLAAAMLAMYWLGGLAVAAVAALAVCGLSYSAMAAAVQNRVLMLAPGSADVASAGTSSAFNVGIAAGSLLGGVIIDGPGVRATALAAGLLVLAAVALLLAEPLLARRRPSTVESAGDGKSRQNDSITGNAAPLWPM
ncbi:MAG TPA: MFS transporter [Dactylosporangium sp.]|jgi:predicted MFS family arabinose efflux permease|nr:MFS transporter [Dactylosporangium sp.]